MATAPAMPYVRIEAGGACPADVGTGIELVRTTYKVQRCIRRHCESASMGAIALRLQVAAADIDGTGVIEGSR